MKKKKSSKFLKDMLPILIILIGILSLKATIVSGKSMNPTLDDKDYLIINKLAYLNTEPKRGDIIVLQSNLLDYEGKHKDLVKRVIGLPGEKLKIENGKVFINDKELDEIYINNINTPGDTDITISENNVFVMGDNRPESLDSRNKEVGNIKIDNIIGKVFGRVYPIEKFEIFKPVN